MVKERLDDLLNRNPSMRLAMQALVSSDLSRKLARAIVYRQDSGRSSPTNESLAENVATSETFDTFSRWRIVAAINGCLPPHQG